MTSSASIKVDSIESTYDAFISYARKDNQGTDPFIDKLVNRLSEITLQKEDSTQAKIWIDRKIPKGENWQNDIYLNIDKSDNVVFILSPNSVNSTNCGLEIAYAVKTNKRIIPIVYQEASSAEIKIFNPELSKINWIFFSKDGQTLDFENSFQELVKALRTDIEYVRYHSTLRGFAENWKNEKGPLLTGKSLENAQQWIISSVSKEPTATDSQLNYIETSRKRDNRRRRTIQAGISAFAIAITIALIIALIQFFRAVTAEKATFAQLQNLAVVNNMQNISLDPAPAKFLRTGTTLWVSHENATTISRYSIDTGLALGEDIEVEAKPTKLLSDNEYIWSLSNGGSLLTRITIADATTVVIHDVPDNPQTMTLAGDWIWVQSEEGLTRIKRATGEADLTLDSDTLEEQIPLENRPELGAPLFDGQYLWLIDKESQKLLRFNDSGTIATVEGFVADSDTGIRVIDNVLWATTPDKLLKIDPTKLQVIAQYSDLGTSLRFGAVDGNNLWLITSSGLVEFDTQTGQNTRTITVTEKVRLIVPDDDRLWVITNAGVVYRYNLTPRQDVTRIVIPNTNSFTNDQVFLADDYLWLADNTRSVIYRITRTDGTLLPAIPGCQTPGEGLFDGVANVWFTCSGNKQLTRIPTNMSYFGVASTGIQESQTVQSAQMEDDLLPRPPYFDGQNLWIILPNIGQLVVIDTRTNREVQRIDFNTSLWPLTPDATGRYLWTAGTANGDVIRLDTQNLTDVLHVKVPASDVTGLKIIEGNVWVSVPALDETTPTLFIISGSDGKILKSRKIDQLTTQAAYDGKAIWLGSGNYGGDGHIYRLQASGTNIGENLSEPTLLSAPIWSPVFSQDKVWATSFLNSGLIFEFDQQGKLIKNLDTPEVGFPSTPIIAGGKLWFTQSTESPPIITRPFDPYHSVMSGVDLETQQQIFTEQPCQNLGQPIVDPQTQFIWVGCLGIGDGKGTIMVIDSTNAKVVHQYEGLGRYAWPAVRIEDSMWIVFRDTSDHGNAAIFNAKDGQLITVFGLGQSPTQPVYDGKGYVWIANTGDGSIQQIDFQSFINSIAK